MTNLQRIQKERSECRSAMNAIIGVAEPTAEQDSDLDRRWRAKYGVLETRERARRPSCRSRGGQLTGHH